MVSEESEHVSNLPVNVFPISDQERQAWHATTILHVSTGTERKLQELSSGGQIGTPGGSERQDVTRR